MTMGGKGKRLLVICAAGLALMTGIFIASPPASLTIEERNRQQCLLNLRIIEEAKERWCLENHYTIGAKPAINDLAKYVSAGVFPRCPEDAAYVIGLIGQNPACPVHPNLLPAYNLVKPL